MKLLDLPVEVVASILDELDTTELMLLAPVAKDSVDLQQALFLIQPRPIILMVRTANIGGYKPTQELQLMHSSTVHDSMPYEESSAIFFDTLKYFSNVKQRTITLRFHLNINDDASCMSELLTKCLTLTNYNIKFKLSFYKYIRPFDPGSLVCFPCRDLEKFNWSSVSIQSPNFHEATNPPKLFEVSKIIHNLPIITLSWLKHSKDLESLIIGEKYRIEEDLSDLYFKTLQKATFESCGKKSCDIWKRFTFRHRKVIKDLTLKHYLKEYNYKAMTKLNRLEFLGFNLAEFEPFSYLLDRKLQLIVKGAGAKCIYNVCKNRASSRTRTYSNVTIGEFKPRPRLKRVLEKDYKMKFIPIRNGDHFPWQVE